MDLKSVLASLMQDPMPPFVVIGGVVVCSAVKIMVTSLDRSAVRARRGLKTRIQELELTVEQLRATISEASSGEAALPAPSHGLNRTLALAMIDGGDAPGTIAAAAGADCGEIELLTKVRRIAIRQSI